MREFTPESGSVDTYALPLFLPLFLSLSLSLALSLSLSLSCMERGSSVVESRTRNRDSPGSNHPFATVSIIGHFRSLH